MPITTCLLLGEEDQHGGEGDGGTSGHGAHPETHEFPQVGEGCVRTFKKYFLYFNESSLPLFSVKYHFYEGYPFRNCWNHMNCYILSAFISQCFSRHVYFSFC